MTESVKAARSSVQLGDLTIDGFMLPDGSYRMSQTQAALCVGKPEINARRFLNSKGIKSLLGKGYTPDTIEIDSDQQSRGQGRFNALPLAVVTAYWFNQAAQSNQQAQSLVWALLTETLERRFDNAFGISRSEDDWNQRLSDRIVAQLENDLNTVMAEADAAIDRERLLERQLRELGVEPWAPPMLRNRSAISCLNHLYFTHARLPPQSEQPVNYKFPRLKQQGVSVMF